MGTFMDSKPKKEVALSSDERILLAIDDKPAGESGSLMRSAGTVSFGVMVSRVLGLVREQMLAYLLPAKIGLDAFYAAFRIPNLLRDMFGEGALSKAFVSAFSEIQEKEGEKAALRLASLVLNTLILVVGALTLLGMIYADIIVDLVLPGSGFDLSLSKEEGFGFETKRELTVALTRVMFPFILLVSLAALVMGVLNARRLFLIPALASSFFNLGSIVFGVGGYLLMPRFGLHPALGIAFGVLAGGALQLLWQIPSLVRLGYGYQPIFSFRDPWLHKLLKLFGPGALIASTVQVNLLINSVFASLSEGWLSWIMQAFRILHLPIGLVGVAVSVATLPALSRSVARDDTMEFRATFSFAIRLVLLFTIPATVGLLILAEPIVRLIFEQGAFGPEDTINVAGALRYYALGLVSFAAVKIVTDGFYAIQDIRAPMMISLCSMVSNAFLNWLFVLKLGMDHRGLALATSFTMTLSFIALWVLFRRRSHLGFLDGRQARILTLKILVASAFMGGFVFAVATGLDRVVGHDVVWARFLQVFGAIAVGVGSFALACKVLQVKEFRYALAAIQPRWLGGE